jgi:hypothetical protein
MRATAATSLIATKQAFAIATGAATTENIYNRLCTSGISLVKSPLLLLKQPLQHSTPPATPTATVPATTPATNSYITLATVPATYLYTKPYTAPTIAPIVI